MLQSHVSSEEFHLKTQCLVDITTNHERLYCNHEKVMQVRRSYYHNQADTMELPRVNRTYIFYIYKSFVFSSNKLHFY